MCVSVTDDILYVHGGYSKEKVSGQKKEGRVHEDMYVRYIVFVFCTALYVLSLCMYNNKCAILYCSLMVGGH